MEPNQQTAPEFAAVEAQAIEKNIIANLTEGLNLTRTNYPIITQKCMAATAALQQVTEIKNDEDDAKVEQLLVKVRKTYDLVKDMRMEITAGLDGIKNKLMEPEKLISNLAADKDSHYNRVKRLRDGYVAAKVQKQKDEAAAAERERARVAECARLHAEFKQRFFNNVLDRVGQLRRDLESLFQKATLENFDSLVKWLNAKPVLKAETFETWFQIQHTLTPEQFTDFIGKVRAAYTYDLVNGQYLQQAQPLIEEYRAKIPERKAELERLAEIAKNDAAAAEAERVRLAEESAAKLRQQEEETKKLQEDNAAKATHEANHQALEATFQAQLVVQNAAPVKGALTKRVAIVECEPKDIVKVFSQVLLQCFMHPSFPGHLKRNGQGMPLPPDEYGVPVYTKWAEDLLTFFAANCAEIPGITFIEKTTSSARARK